MDDSAEYAAGSFQVSTKSLDAFLEPSNVSSQTVFIRFARMRSQNVEEDLADKSTLTFCQICFQK